MKDRLSCIRFKNNVNGDAIIVRFNHHLLYTECSVYVFDKDNIGKPKMSILSSHKPSKAKMESYQNYIEQHKQYSYVGAYWLCKKNIEKFLKSNFENISFHSFY